MKVDEKKVKEYLFNKITKEHCDQIAFELKEAGLTGDVDVSINITEKDPN